MKLLVIGSGGGELAISKKLATSSLVSYNELVKLDLAEYHYRKDIGFKGIN